MKRRAVRLRRGSCQVQHSAAQPAKEGRLGSGRGGGEGYRWWLQAGLACAGGLPHWARIPKQLVLSMTSASHGALHCMTAAAMGAHGCSMCVQPSGGVEQISPHGALHSMATVHVAMESRWDSLCYARWQPKAAQSKCVKDVQHDVNQTSA